MKKFWSALSLVAVLAAPAPAFATRSSHALRRVTEKNAFVAQSILITPNWLQFSSDNKAGFYEDVRCGIVNVQGSHDVRLNDYIYYRQTLSEPSPESPSIRREKTSFKVIGYKNYVAAILVRDRIGTKYIVVTEGVNLDDPTKGIVTLKGEYDRRTDTLENLKAAPEEQFAKRSKILEIYNRTRKQVFELAKSPQGRELLKMAHARSYREERERTANPFFEKTLFELKKTLGRPATLTPQ